MRHKNLWKAHCNFYDPRKAINIVVNKIFDEHEAQLKAKDEEIERLKAGIKQWQKNFQKHKEHEMTLREKIEVMEAFERGEEIEVKHRDSAMDWTLTKQPLWDWTKSTFRIKPKPKQTVTIEKWRSQL